jgi:hypothetical protein
MLCGGMPANFMKLSMKSSMATHHGKSTRSATMAHFLLEPLQWMTESYEHCLCDVRQVLLHHQLASTKFKDKINLVPYKQFDKEEQCSWSNLMLGDWAWKQVVHLIYLFAKELGVNTYLMQDIIAEDAPSHGAMFVPIVAGSDKTIVSTSTGHQEYHPVYMSPRNLTNFACCAHGTSLLLVAFLPIPKCMFCSVFY